MRGSLVFFLLLSVMAVSEARMYQWVNPHTGTVQLSGAPPSWYRGAQEGPRVLVFDQGRVVDDTAIAVNASSPRAPRGGVSGSDRPTAFGSVAAARASSQGR